MWMNCSPARPRMGRRWCRPISARAYVDLNRDPDELDPDMFDERPRPTPACIRARVQAGLGAIPRVTSDGHQIYTATNCRWRRPSAGIALFHRPYHAMLAALIAETKAEIRLRGAGRLPFHAESARGAHAPDIVLGDRFGAACHPSVTALAEATLRRLGYRVARNAPFAGGHTTQTYGRPLNQRACAADRDQPRALSWMSGTLERTTGFARVRADMTRLAEALGRGRAAQELGLKKKKPRSRAPRRRYIGRKRPIGRQRRRETPQRNKVSAAAHKAQADNCFSRCSNVYCLHYY